MRALAADTERALTEPLTQLDINWSIGMRTGDTSVAERARQSRRLPTALITTPESLSLLLTRPDAREMFASLKLVVVDEWHELIGNKRGVQLQLALVRLRHWQPQLMTWGLSATLGNLEHAMHVLNPSAANAALLVQGKLAKNLFIDTLLPPGIERFPWAGHLGLRMLPQVVEQIESSATSLIFTNTRSQCEIWYRALLQARPDWAGLVALHHGSLDRKVRAWVELGLKEGRLKAVVCTSSLDLGVDFLPVERVLQIGSPKGVARLMQRAGRSGHAPGRPSRLTLVPTHSLELIESIAAQDAIAVRNIEPRESPHKPLDVLVQPHAGAGRSRALGPTFQRTKIITACTPAKGQRAALKFSSTSPCRSENSIRGPIVHCRAILTALHHAQLFHVHTSLRVLSHFVVLHAMMLGVLLAGNHTVFVRIHAFQLHALVHRAGAVIHRASVAIHRAGAVIHSAGVMLH